MKAEQLLKAAAVQQASDIFIIAGMPPALKVSGRIVRQGDALLRPEDTDLMIRELYALGKRDPKNMFEHGDDDFSFSLAGISRYRVSIYRQRGSLAAVVRVIAFSLPDPRELGIPETSFPSAVCPRASFL